VNGKVGPPFIGTIGIAKALLVWGNDCLMAEIFFLVGMDLKGVVIEEHHRRTYLHENTSNERIENRERQRL
jgi:hypothetical protein